MQADCQPSAVSAILEMKVDVLVHAHMDLLKATECLEEQLSVVQIQVNKLTSSESYTTKDALILAADMDELQDKIITCHKTLSNRSSSQEPAELLSGPITGLGQSSHAGVSVNKSSVGTEQHATVMNIVEVQIKTFQEQMSVLQKSHDKRLQELEIKVLGLQENQILPKDNFDLRMQKVEAQFLLLQNIQLRENTSIKNVEDELSKLRTDILSMQNDVSGLDFQQDVCGERIEDLKRKTNDLLTLRNVLNDLHKNVTQREELTKKVNELEVGVDSLNLAFGAENLLGLQHDISRPVFVASTASRHVVKPGGRVSFADVQLESEGYDPTTSIFTAPMGGLYLFSVSLNTDSAATLAATLMKNYQKEALFATSGRKDEQTSVTVFLRLCPGDSVWVEANTQTNPAGVFIGTGFSNFVGCLLF